MSKNTSLVHMDGIVNLGDIDDLDFLLLYDSHCLPRWDQHTSRHISNGKDHVMQLVHENHFMVEHKMSLGAFNHLTELLLRLQLEKNVTKSCSHQLITTIVERIVGISMR